MRILTIALTSCLLVFTEARAQLYSMQLGVPFALSGVNCHSTSLQRAGLMDYPSYVNEPEILFVLQSQCFQVPRNQMNTIAIRGIGTMFSHSYFHETETQIFEKRSLGANTTYERKTRGFSSVARYYSCFPEPIDCRHPILQQHQHDTDEIGRYWADFLRRGDRQQERDQQRNRLIALLNHRFTNVPRQCERAVRRLKLRQQSLKELSDQFYGGRMFIQMMPRSPGRG